MTHPRIDELRARLTEASEIYRSALSTFDALAYFNGVLAGFGGLTDWVITPSSVPVVTETRTRFELHLDFGVQFDEESNFLYIPLSIY